LRARSAATAGAGQGDLVFPADQGSVVGDALADPGDRVVAEAIVGCSPKLRTNAIVARVDASVIPFVQAIAPVLRRRAIACRRMRSPRDPRRGDRVRHGAIIRPRRVWLLLLGECERARFPAAASVAAAAWAAASKLSQAAM
jgi:hypothetical protein